MARKRNGSGSNGAVVDQPPTETQPVDSPKGDTPHDNDGRERTQPVHRVRLRNVSAAIWRNEGERGPWFAATFSRSYRDQNGNWHSSDNFAGPDLLLLAEVARQAFLWICNQTQGNGSNGGGGQHGNGHNGNGSNGTNGGSGDDIPF